MYFYELHEAEGDIFSDLILVHEERFEPDEFLELVRAASRRVRDSYDENTLIEAVARLLEEDQGFTTVSDDRLTASVLVTTNEDETQLSMLEAADQGPDWGDEDIDENDIDEDDLPDYRAVIAELRPTRDPQLN
ncbi:MAG TPA: hypothetical protein VFC81_04800 [Verrucomicrobiae bacterium]|nr:hypothetical protein [Verrucomicrobiae bacterium]